MQQDILVTNIVKVGKYAMEFLEENIIVLFGEGCPRELLDYCVIIQNYRLHFELMKNDKIIINGNSYIIQYMGSHINKNMNELGHITIRLLQEECNETILPGSVYVIGKKFSQLYKDMQIQFLKEASNEENSSK